jgi:Tol biopolymer transport system component
MSKLRSLPWLVVLVLVLAPASRAAETAPAKSLITAADLLNIKQLESPALSPDGKWLVYVVRSIEAKPDAKDDWVYRTQLWLAATDGRTQPRQLTFGLARNSAPAWSPSGDRLVFVRSADKEKPQIYVMSLAGGEAQPLTKIDTGAGGPRWSPDGTKILFTSSLSYDQVRSALEKAGKSATPPWAGERPARKANDTGIWIGKDDKHPEAKPDGTLQEMRDWLAKNEADGNPRVMNRLNFLAEGDLATESDFTQFYTVDAQGGAEQAITLGYEGFANPEWLADGKSIACVGPRKMDVHTDRDRFSSLYIIDAATGKARVLLEEGGVNYGAPQPSPDGKWIAFTRTSGGEFSFEQPVVAVVATAGGTPISLTPDLDRPAGDLTWSPDGKFIYFTAADHGRFPLYRVLADNAGE